MKENEDKPKIKEWNNFAYFKNKFWENKMRYLRLYIIYYKKMKIK